MYGKKRKKKKEKKTFYLSCNIAAKRVQCDFARFTTHIKPIW